MNTLPSPTLLRHAHVASVQEREAPRQGQAEAGALLLPSRARVDLVELSKILAWSASAMPMPVSATAISTAPPQARRRDGHGAALRRELDGVGDQVEQHLLELAGVGQHLAGAGDVGAAIRIFFWPASGSTVLDDLAPRPAPTATV